MYNDIDRMITCYIIFAKIPVKGECKACNRAIHLITDVQVHRVCIKGLKQRIRVQVV
ncbi:MAG: hypothetical protein ACNYWU_03455 [Desulfobacterales bacterium]